MSIRSTLVRGKRRPRGSEGFALIATLVVIGITSVLILAMLSLSLTSSAFSHAQVQRDTSTRAADSAIEAGINVLVREAQTAGRVDQTDPCVLAERNADGLPEVTVDGTKVVITCTPQSPDAPPAPLPGEPGFEQVKVVGTDYGAGGGSTVPAAAAWTSALSGLPAASATAANSYANSGATVLHSGPGPLTFSSDVTVRKGAAAVRDPAASGGRAFGPAMAVSGLYFQGDSGLSDTNQTNTKDCGAQSRWNDPPTRAAWITTIRIDPKCAASEATGLTPEGSDLSQPYPWPSTALDAPATLPACNRTVITINPGVYGPAQTAQLNRWFSTAECNNKTFLFRSGAYFFDVDDATQGANRNALVFDDPTSLVVFGDPDQWNPDEQPSVATVGSFFPQACALNTDGVDGKSTGVNITLSSRTTIQHERGRVSICDQRTSKDPVTAIWQTATLTPDWSVAPGGTPTSPVADPTQTPIRVQFANAGNINSTDGAVARADASCDRQFFGSGFLAGIFGLRTCERTTRGSLVIGTFSQAVPTVASPIDSLKLDIVGSTRNISNAGGLFTIRIVGANIPTGSCQVASNSTSSVARTLEVLDESIGDCAAKIDDVRDLAGATVEMTYDFAPQCRVVVIFGYNLDSTTCRSSDLPYLSVDSVTVLAESALDRGAVTTPFLVTSDADPTNASDVATFNVFGRVSVPRADLDIRWNGAPTSAPIFGGTLVVNGISSSASSAQDAAGAYIARPGIVCCTLADPSERIVVLSSWVDVTPDGSRGFTGRLAATARVAIEDYLIGVSGQPQYSPGNRVRVETWQLCDPVMATFPGLDPTASSVACRPI